MFSKSSFFQDLKNFWSNLYYFTLYKADLAEEKELVDYLEATKISDESTSNSTESGGNLENSECLKDREVYEYGSFHAQWAVNDIDRPDELDFKIKKVDFCP